MLDAQETADIAEAEAAAGKAAEAAAVAAGVFLAVELRRGGAVVGAVVLLSLQVRSVILQQSSLPLYRSSPSAA